MKVAILGLVSVPGSISLPQVIVAGAMIEVSPLRIAILVKVFLVLAIGLLAPVLLSIVPAHPLVVGLLTPVIVVLARRI